MARASEGNEQLLCSFCGKSQRQVKKLIAGPGVYICDECIDLCNEIIDEELATPTHLDLESLPRPKEIYASLNDYVVSQEEAKRTLAVAVAASRRLGARIPADVIGVSESGLTSRADLEELAGQGYRAFLIGERFMTAPNPAAAIAELLGGVT